MASEDDLLLEERKLSMMKKMREVYTDKAIESQEKIVEALKNK